MEETVIEEIKRNPSTGPFGLENRELAYLLANGEIDYSDYLKLSEEFCERNSQQNRYLGLFKLSPRTFGQTWGEQHIMDLFPQFMKATKENLATLYPSFDGEFDLWLDGIRVEVKACRANNDEKKESLESRAYSHEEAKKAHFKYHYQQLKPSCCDVFIWMGVCRDELIYWVLSSDELKKTGKLGPQHRNQNTGRDINEVYEGQVFMTEEELSPFLVCEQHIPEAVRMKCMK